MPAAVLVIEHKAVDKRLEMLKLGSYCSLIIWTIISKEKKKDMDIRSKFIIKFQSKF